MWPAGGNHVHRRARPTAVPVYLSARIVFRRCEHFGVGPGGEQRRAKFQWAQVQRRGAHASGKYRWQFYATLQAGLAAASEPLDSTGSRYLRASVLTGG